MHIKIFLTYTTLLFLTAKGDPDPRTFYASTPNPVYPSSSALPDYEEKEDVVYLTKSQIQALQSGQGVLESQSEFEDPQENQDVVNRSEDYFDYDDQLREQFQLQKSFIELQPNFDINQNQEKTSAPVEEPNQEEPREEPPGNTWYSKNGNIYSSPETQKLARNEYYAATSERPETNKYFVPTSELLENNRHYDVRSENTDNTKYTAVTTEKPENLPYKSFNYFSVYNEKKGDNIDIKVYHPTSKDSLKNNLEAKELEAQKNQLPIKKFKLVPYEYQNEQLSEVESTKRNSGRQFEFILSPVDNKEKKQAPKFEQKSSDVSEQNSDDEVPTLKYKFRYNDQRQAIKAQELLKIQKAEAENKSKRPAERRTKVTKTVQESDPYVVRVAQPVKIKVSKTYSTPIELIRRIPIEIEEAENIEAESPASYEIKRRVKVDKPYLIERIVPVDVRKEASEEIKPQKLRVLGRVWKQFS